MKYSALIATLGAAPFAASILLYPNPPEIKPTPVRTETIRQIPITKANTLVERWYFPHVTEIKVKQIQAEESSPPPPKAVIQRQARVTRDVCSRHGMRKVMVGRYKWRCRR
jgi:hypothetical protein